VAFDYPVFLDLSDVPVLLVGGGAVATRKLEGLIAAGARVTVVAPVICDAVRAMPADLVVRSYVADDIAQHQLVMTATDDPEVNAKVARDARAAGVFVNSADDPVNCSFILPAVHRQGAVIAAVSTGGASPALAQHLRSRIAEIVTPQVARAAEELARQRREIQAAGGSTEDIDWAPRVQAALDH
jgi:siroheme synthase-like protein